MLENLEKIMSHTLDSAGQNYNNFINSVQSCLDIVTRNRAELSPSQAPTPFDEDTSSDETE